MARPLCDGVGYFPKDTAFYTDDKVRLLRAEFGAKGMYLLDYILCEIYGKDGYFMKWDKSKCYLVSDGAGCGCDPSFVEKFVNGCFRCDFFDRSVFEAYGVLTSAGIQRRYVRMFNGRDYIRLIKEYFLLDVSDKKDITGGILEKCTFVNLTDKENPVKIKENPDKNKDNPTNKSKVNKINILYTAHACARTREEISTVGSTNGSTNGSKESFSLSKGKIDELRSKGVPSDYIKFCLKRMKERGYQYDDLDAAVLSWWQKDKHRWCSPPTGKEESSFDTDEFFEAALRRSYGDKYEELFGKDAKGGE